MFMCAFQFIFLFVLFYCAQVWWWMSESEKMTNHTRLIRCMGDKSCCAHNRQSCNCLVCSAYELRTLCVCYVVIESLFYSNTKQLCYNECRYKSTQRFLCRSPGCECRRCIWMCAVWMVIRFSFAWNAQSWKHEFMHAYPNLMNVYVCVCVLHK